MIEIIPRNFDDILKQLSLVRQKTLVVAGSDDHDVLAFCQKAEKFCNLILIGEEKSLTDLLNKYPLDPNNFSLIFLSDPQSQVEKAVQVIREGRGALLMKGKVKSNTFLKAILNKEQGLCSQGILSHIMVMQRPQGGFFLLTDGGIVIKPKLEEKIAILDRAVRICAKLGISKPKIWISAVSPDNLKEAAGIAQLAKEKQPGELEILLSSDPDFFPPEFDILLVPNIETGNITGKSLMYFSRLKYGLMVAGASVPIILTSRVDPPENRFNSLLLCLYLA